MPHVIKEYPNIVEKVVDNGYCVGCGGCAYLSDAIEMQKNIYGQMIPVVDLNQGISAEENTVIESVCPFNDTGAHENEIGKDLFASSEHDAEIGHFRDIYAGRVVHEDYYQKGSSGGIGKWLLATLLESNEIDYVVQVSATEPKDNPNGSIYKFSVFSRADEVIQGSKSAYYPIEMSEVLHFMRRNEGRYMLTGVPCFVKMVRRLCLQDTVIANRVTYLMSIVCGHLKTEAYAQMIGWQLGVEPSELAHLDFRKKIPGKKANQKGVQAIARSGKESKSDIVQNLFGTNYGYGFFKYEACDYCDDVVGETADISVGDAWLPQFMNAGTSLVIVRHPRLSEILKEKISDLSLEKLTSKQAADSQRSGFRHRREYLRYRLFLKQAEKLWFPKKRVTPAKSHLNFNAKKIVETRIELAKASHKSFLDAKREESFQLFVTQTLPYIERLHDLTREKWKYYLARTLRKIGVYGLLAKIAKS